MKVNHPGEYCGIAIYFPLFPQKMSQIVIPGVIGKMIIYVRRLFQQRTAPSTGSFVRQTHNSHAFLLKTPAAVDKITKLGT
jgi:hypothetical protein